MLYSDANDSITLGFSAGYGVGYFGNGLPDLADAPGAGMVAAYGYSENNGKTQGSIIWAVNSVTPAPVPLPDTVWLLICGLGALGALGLRSNRVVRAIQHQ